MCGEVCQVGSVIQKIDFVATESINESGFNIYGWLFYKDRIQYGTIKILQNGKPVTMELHWQKHGRPVQRNHSYPV